MPRTSHAAWLLAGLLRILQRTLSEFPANSTPATFTQKHQPNNRSHPVTPDEQHAREDSMDFSSAVESNAKTLTWRRAMVVLATFHAVLHKRSSYVQTGCTLDMADFVAATQQVS